MKNYKKVLASACAVLCLTAFTACASKSEKLLEFVDAGDYAAASDYYDDKIDDSSKEREIRKEIRRGMKKRYDDILEKYDKGEITDEAFEDFFELMEDLKIDEDDKDYSEFLSKYNQSKNYKEYYKLGLDNIEKEYYDDAIYYFKRIPEESGSYKKAQEKIKECEDKLAEVKLSDVEGYIKSENYTSAVTTLYRYKDELSENEKYKELWEKASKGLTEYLKKNEEDEWASGDYYDAYYLISDYSYYDIDEISKMYNSYSDDYIKYVVNKADEYAKKEDYEGAIEFLETAYSNYSSSSFTDAIDKYKKFLPTYITELDYSDIEGSINKTDRKDSKGTEHKSALCVDGSGENEFWIEYDLNGDYNIFTGTAGVSYYERSADETKYFEIYADGKLIYKSPVMSKESELSPFTLDVTKVKKLKIVYPATEGSNSIATLYDGLFTKGDTKGITFTKLEGEEEATTEATTEAASESAETTTTAAAEDSAETTTTTTTTA